MFAWPRQSAVYARFEGYHGMILLDGLRWSFLLRCDAHRPLSTEPDVTSLAIGENLAGSLIHYLFLGLDTPQ